MRRTFAAMALLLLASPALADKPLAVAKVEARLFFNYSGKLSKPIGPDTVLFNAIIGEGNIDEPSNSTFVDVTVEGEPGSFEPKARVELLVLDASDGKLLQTLSNGVGVLNSAGKYHVGFWLPKTGCDALKLRARIAGSKASRTLSVPFECGE